MTARILIVEDEEPLTMILRYNLYSSAAIIGNPAADTSSGQALDLMNDPTYLEASRVLAERAMHEGGSNPIDRSNLRLTIYC